MQAVEYSYHINVTYNHCMDHDPTLQRGLRTGDETVLLARQRPGMHPRADDPCPSEA